MFNLTPATQEEHDSLVEKCQKNGWLKRGGFDWQDDPWLEEYPYDFSRAPSIKDLADFFSNGNWAIRQGVLFGDLAFIQQVNGGDEWWTLKRCPDGSWLDFESYSMNYILPDMSRFTQAIASMQLATPDECKHLEYSVPKTSLIWEGEAFPDDSSGFIRAHDENFELEVVASRIGRGISMTAREEVLEGLDSENFSTLLEQIRAAVERADQYEKAVISTDTQGLSDKARHAIVASKNQMRSELSEQARANGNDAFLADATAALDPAAGIWFSQDANGDHGAEADGKVSIVDAVAYSNLEPGKTHRLSGILMDKMTGEPVISEGEEVAAEVEFAPVSSDGVVDVVFEFDGSALAGHDVVALEELFRAGGEWGKALTRLKASMANSRSLPFSPE